MCLWFRLVKQRQRQIHEKLLLAKSMPLSMHCKYFLVPSSWISKWRSYMSSSVKNSDKPETLDGIINSMMCEKVHCTFTLVVLHLVDGMHQFDMRRFVTTGIQSNICWGLVSIANFNCWLVFDSSHLWLFRLILSKDLLSLSW